MSDTAAFDNDDEVAANWIATLRERRAREHKITKAQARAIISRETSVSVGTLENIERHRVKGVRHAIFERIKTAMIRQLEKEIGRLGHELQMVRARGGSDSDLDVRSIMASVDALRQKIGGVK